MLYLPKKKKDAKKQLKCSILVREYEREYERVCYERVCYERKRKIFSESMFFLGMLFTEKKKTAMK